MNDGNDTSDRPVSPRVVGERGDRGEERTGYRSGDRSPRPLGREVTAGAGLEGPPICDLCGSPMLERHCRLVCLSCGYERDCSDP